jgi:hypothetical protein
MPSDGSHPGLGATAHSTHPPVRLSGEDGISGLDVRLM